MTPENYAAEANIPGPQAAKPVMPEAAAAWDALRNNANEFKARFVIPSWSRGIITVAVLVLIGAGAMWSGSSLAAFFAAGAVSMAIPAFFAWLLNVLAWAIAIYFGGKLMLKVGKYFLTERIDYDLARARDTVAHALTPSPKPRPA